MYRENTIIFANDAMNTIRSIFNTSGLPYTVIGGIKTRIDTPKPLLSIILLNRGGRFHRDELLNELDSMDSVEVLYIEGAERSYDIEPLSKKNQSVKFLLFQESISPGEKINCGIEESAAPLSLVMWSDMRLIQKPIPEKVLNKIESSGLFCTVPVIKNARHEIIPTILIPGLLKRNLQVLPFNAVKDSSLSVFPFDYCGIYHKERFFQIGGYDVKIGNPYWQKMDLGFRAFMWGETISLNSQFSVQYSGTPPAEDATPDSSYKYFFLKNMFVSHKNGYGSLGFLKFFHYMAKSDSGPLTSLREFMEVKHWVSENRNRFKTDARKLIKSWEISE
jgi:hypothetical protein